MATKNYTSFFSIFLVLLRRDLITLRYILPGMLIDSCILLLSSLLVFAGFLPHLGLPAQMIGPLYIGSQISLFFFIGYTFALKKTADLQFNRFIDYQTALPLPNWYIFAEYIIFFMIESTITTLPLLVVGMYVLGSKMGLLSINIFFFGIMFFLTVLFVSSFFLMLSFYYQYHWFMRNIWPRRLTPLFVLSCNIMTWHSVNNFSPFFGKILLLNPFTYLAEGLRVTLFANKQLYLPLTATIPVTILMICISWILLLKGIKKRIDPV